MSATTMALVTGSRFGNSAIRMAGTAKMTAGSHGVAKSFCSSFLPKFQLGNT
jgi:hypothetical protein